MRQRKDSAACAEAGRATPAAIAATLGLTANDLHFFGQQNKEMRAWYAKVSSKTWGDRVHIYLNGDFVLAVTPADAQATGYKSAAQLAPVWVNAVKKGFNEAHVGASGGAR